MSIRNVLFVGSKTLGVNILNIMYSVAPDMLVGAVTIDDSNDVRCALPKFQEFGIRTGKPLHVLRKASELKNTIEMFKPDMCIVAGWYWVLKAELLEAVPHGWLGIHASLLPKYRGSSPLVWAILNGEKKTGLSLFYFDEGMDTGDIVAQREIDIDIDDSISNVLDKLEIQSQEVIRENYPLLIAQKSQRYNQDHRQATYVAFRQPSDGKIDWNMPASRIYDFIRAQTHPYPGAFGYLNDKVLKVWRSRVFDYPYFGSPGQVAMVAKDHVVVTCGNGTGICIYDVDLEGSDVQVASQVLKFGQKLT